MDNAHFLVKIDTLRNKLAGITYQVKVFDSIVGIMHVLKYNEDDILKGYSVSDSIIHFLRLNEKFNYKHYNVFFVTCDKIKF